LASPPKSPSPRREGDLANRFISPSLFGGGVWGEAIFASNYKIALFFFLQLFVLMFLSFLRGGGLCGKRKLTTKELKG
jgi:hypothetical protein